MKFYTRQNSLANIPRNNLTPLIKLKSLNNPISPAIKQTETSQMIRQQSFQKKSTFVQANQLRTLMSFKQQPSEGNKAKLLEELNAKTINEYGADHTRKYKDYI